MARTLIVVALYVAALFAATEAVAMTPSELQLWLASTGRVQRVAAPNGSRLPYVTVTGSPARGFIAGDAVDRGFLRTDQELVIVPLDSGGSAGIAWALLFTRLNGQRRFIGYIPGTGGQLRTFIEAGVLHTVMPVYRDTDPNCCPSRHRYQTYALHGITLTTVDDYVAP